jgi:Zn-dependent protease
MTQLPLIQKITIWVIPVLFAITVHEVAHGWVASKFGDQTAKLSGRLTLNPIKHIDLIGTIVVPLLLLMIGNFIFGWAKPVPVDARNLRNPRYNMILVALAGPGANFLMALIWAGVAKIGFSFSPWFREPLVLMGGAGIMINVVLGVLNCIPIPPLDGARALYNLLPGRLAWYFFRVEPYGFFILIILMMTGVLASILSPAVNFVVSWIVTIFGLR